MLSRFDIDPYPGNPKILFIGLGVSTHTYSWIDLLSESKLNVRLFSVPSEGIPPPDWKIPTYICISSSQLPEGLDPAIRQSLYPLPEEIKSFENVLEEWKSILEKRKNALEKNTVFMFSNFLRNKINFGMRFGMPYLDYDYSQYSDLQMPKNNFSEISSPEEWLANIIQGWQPDIIHTLGLFDGQGGTFYYEVRQQFGIGNIGKWILQLRGGSDLALRQFHPETAKQIRETFNECDEIITDNYVNINYIQQLGFAHKVASIAPVAGTGGVDTDIEIDDIILPSKRERIILWPKAYESWWSKALPVMEAIRLAWKDIQPCQIYMTASSPETEAWFLTILPQEVKENCIIVHRLPRNDLLDLMKRARVLLIPSLVDGVPNSLYEAMAHGIFPIVSPLGSITPIVENISNVLFARNLYPTEISEALVKAMSDDLLVDNAAKNNLDLVKQIASREKIAKRVVEYYQRLSSEGRQ
jgi:glycosyltransferase involved in cell wall biosynthesis